MSLTRIVESFRMEKSRMHVFYIFTLKYIFALQKQTAHAIVAASLSYGCWQLIFK